MDEKYLTLIGIYNDNGISLAGMTSLLFINGLTDMRYGEVRKNIHKELQRIDTLNNLKK